MKEVTFHVTYDESEEEGISNIVLCVETQGSPLSPEKQVEILSTILVRVFPAYKWPV